MTQLNRKSQPWQRIDRGPCSDRNVFRAWRKGGNWFTTICAKEMRGLSLSKDNVCFISLSLEFSRGVYHFWVLCSEHYNTILRTSDTLFKPRWQCGYYWLPLEKLNHLATGTNLTLDILKWFSMFYALPNCVFTTTWLITDCLVVLFIIYWSLLCFTWNDWSYSAYYFGSICCHCHYHRVKN